MIYWVSQQCQCLIRQGKNGGIKQLLGVSPDLEHNSAQPASIPRMAHTRCKIHHRDLFHIQADCLLVLYKRDGMGILDQELSSMTRSTSLLYQHSIGSRYPTILKTLDTGIPVILLEAVRYFLSEAWILIPDKSVEPRPKHIKVRLTPHRTLSLRGWRYST